MEMGNGRKVLCVLCQKCDETEVTGALATKGGVTAHQNCLLYSSGLYCSSSPQFDDLFGFSVDDVLAEVKRGRLLRCNGCLLMGATAGCEVRRCKKSYHYPCAVKHKAKLVEDAVQEKYALFCNQHSGSKEKNSGSVNGRPSPVVGSETPVGEAGSSTSSCNKRAPASLKMNTRGSPTKVRRVSESSSDSSGGRPSTSKKRLRVQDKRGGTRSKRKATVKISTEDSSDADAGTDEDMAVFGPVETDSPGSPTAELIRKDGESPAGSTSGTPPVNGTTAAAKEDDVTILHDSDAESESLLPALPSSRSESAQRSDDGSSPAAIPPPPPPRHSQPDTSSTFPSVAPPPSPTLNSTSFWKSCNAAGCTQALFAGFLNEMNEICSRIQSDRASKEDYDHALTVMNASGKLAQVVAKQQEELQQKQCELQKAAAAMEAVVSAMRM